jgi:acetyl-CoA C-acetyltransferase
MTGGLPFFGGPGNNYSMHALCAMTRALRSDREAFGVVGANGGFLSKHSVGVYSACRPKAPWTPQSDAEAQALLDATPSAPWEARAEGEGVIETYTVTWRSGAPSRVNIVGRLKANGRRFLAVSDRDDAETPRKMTIEDPLGAVVSVAPAERGNRFRL